MLRRILADLTFARPGIRCVRHGHNLLCNSDGHLCVRCGRPEPKETP